jgi:hypothetical protein
VYTGTGCDGSPRSRTLPVSASTVLSPLSPSPPDPLPCPRRWRPTSPRPRTYAGGVEPPERATGPPERGRWGGPEAPHRLLPCCWVRWAASRLLPAPRRRGRASPASPGGGRQTRGARRGRGAWARWARPAPARVSRSAPPSSGPGRRPGPRLAPAETRPPRPPRGRYRRRGHPAGR